MTDSPKSYSLSETAALLSVSESTLHRYIRSGAVPFQTLNRKLMIPHAFLQGLVDEAMNEGGQRNYDNYPY
jgi:predicted site-specific integrase-resolvase